MDKKNLVSELEKVKATNSYLEKDKNET